MERFGDAPVDPPRLLDRHRATVLALGCAYLAAVAVVAVVPIVTTPYRSDDLISRDVGQAFADSGISIPGYIWDWVEPWITRTDGSSPARPPGRSSSAPASRRANSTGSSSLRWSC